MADRKIKIIGIILATLLILLVTASIGYFIAAKYAVYSSKKIGYEIDYLPEKITKIETEYKSQTGIHFRGKSGKLYRCNNAERSCEAISPEPEKYTDKKPFEESKQIHPNFKEPTGTISQIVGNYSRGYVGHKTISEYALLNDGKVWFWIYSGNDMGDSFPFWHLNNWLTLFVGTILGLVVGLFISGLVWFGFYPRN